MIVMYSGVDELFACFVPFCLVLYICLGNKLTANHAADFPVSLGLLCSMDKSCPLIRQCFTWIIADFVGS